MALTSVAGLITLLLVPALAHGQTSDGGTTDTAIEHGAPLDGGTAGDAGGASPRDGAAEAPATFEQPHPVTSTNVLYPPGAPEITAPVAVTVKLLVDVTGTVQKVELRTPPQPPFDDAVLIAARAFRFAPGRYGGMPVPVEITFTHRFLPRPPPPPAATVDEGPARTAILRGRLIELGTRAPVTGAFGSPCPPGPRAYRSMPPATIRSSRRRLWRPIRSSRLPTSSSAIATTPMRS